MIEISGSHGFLGEHLMQRLPGAKRLGRGGYCSADTVFNLAAYGNLIDQKNIRQTYESNLMAVINAVEGLEDQRYIFISTSSVKLPVQTYYSLSKKAAEDLLRLSGKNVAIVRPASIIGVGEQSIHLVPKLIDSCLNGTPMPFVPEPTHDFIDVRDMVEALIVVKDKAEFKGEIYEVGQGKKVSNQEVLETVERVTGKKANITVVESMRKYDTANWEIDTIAIRGLGWEPKFTLEDTISEMVKALDR